MSNASNFEPLMSYTRENLGASKDGFKAKMLMTRKSRVAMEQASLVLVKPSTSNKNRGPALRKNSTSRRGKNGDSDDDCDASMAKMARFSSSKHVPFLQVLSILGMAGSSSQDSQEEEEDTTTLSCADLKYLFEVLSARTREAPFPEKLKPTVQEIHASVKSLGEVFRGFRDKSVIPKATLIAKLTGALDESFRKSVNALVDFICYNCRDRVRFCDLEAALSLDPSDGVGNQQAGNDNDDDAAATTTKKLSPEEDDPEAAAALKELENITAAIEEAERLAFSSVNEEEISKVINFLDPSNDGEVDLRELESAFRIARRDKTKGKIDLDAQEAEMESLKAQLADLSVVVEEESDFSNEEIDLVMGFMDPNGDGITTDEFEGAFRDARRARATAVEEIKGREALAKLLSQVKEAHPDFESPTEWFNLCNTNPGPPGSPVEVTGLELKAGLKKLGGFKGSDIGALLKYMDPDGDCDLTIPEFEAAVEKLDKPAESESKAAEAGAVIVRLEEHMDDANIRMIDLFRMMDKDGEGSIEPDEMRAGLKKIALPSGVERARMKIAKDKLIKRITKKIEERKKQMALDKRLQEAEESGAAKVLTNLEARMVKKGQRMVDLFREMDKSGDGQISRLELFEGLKAIAGPTAHQRAMMKRAVEKQERVMAEMKARQLKEEETREKILLCRDSGAAAVLGRLYDFITEGEQEKKIQDVFREYDRSGEGSLSHSELALAMDLMDMELTDSEVVALIEFLDENGDGDVDLRELDDAMKGFLRIRRQDPDFGRQSERRISAEAIDKLVDSIGEVSVQELTQKFAEQNNLRADVLSNPKFNASSKAIKASKKRAEWLNASRLSRAPTGRLPSLEDQLSDEQKLHLEAAKLRLKKEKKIAGEAHFKHWLKKKGAHNKKKLVEIIKTELEEVDLPPFAVLNDEQVGSIVDFAAATRAEPEGGTASSKSLSYDRVRAVFSIYSDNNNNNNGHNAAQVAEEIEKLKESASEHGAAKAALSILWKHKGKTLAQEVEQCLQVASDPLPVDDLKGILKSKLSMSQNFGSLESFRKAKDDFERQEKQRKRKEGEEAWKEWSEKKARDIKDSKRARRREYKELLAKQKVEYEKIKEEKRRRREEERRRSQGSLPQFSNASIVSSKTKLTRRTAYTSASTMSNSVALSLCEASISPYGVDPGKPYSKKNIHLREKLKAMRKHNKKLPLRILEGAEAFRKEVLGPIPKRFKPIVGKMVGQSGFIESDSLAASSISADSLLEDQIIFDKESAGMRGGGGRGRSGSGRPPRSVKASGRPSKAVGRPVKSTAIRGKVGGAKRRDNRAGGRPENKGREGGRQEHGSKEEEEEEEEEEEYANDFEDFPAAPGSAGEDNTLVSFNISEAFPKTAEFEEEVGETLDFFNTEAVAELPMEVYGDDFEDYDEGGQTYKTHLIEAVPPPAGHFSRPSTSGDRPVSRSSSTEGSRQGYEGSRGKKRNVG